MTLQASELIQTYQYFHHIFPEDVHIARPLVQYYQKNGSLDQAYRMAEDMGRRMFSLGNITLAQSFLRLCLQLQPEDSGDIQSMLDMADVMEDAPSGDACTFSLIEKLSDQEAGKFMQQGCWERCPKGKVLIHQGDVDSRFYVILEGAMGVHLKLADDQDLYIKTLVPGEYFGEYACIYRLPRTATVVAEEDSLLLAFSDDVVASLMDLSPEAGDVLMRIVVQRLIQSMTHVHPAFSDVVEGDHQWVGEESCIIDLNHGNILSYKDDVVYILLYGELLVLPEVDGCRVFSENDMFGALHSHLSLPVGAQVQSNQRSLLCAMPREIFDSFMRAYGSFERWVDAQKS